MDNQGLLQLQSDYINYGTGLDDIARGLEIFLTEIIGKVKSKYNIYINADEIRNIADDITGDIIRRYLSIDNYHIDNYFSYCYRAVSNRLYDRQYKSARHYNIDDYVSSLQSDDDVELEFIGREQGQEVINNIMQIVDNYTSGYHQDIKDEIYTHIINTIGRKKNIKSYLYKIKRKDIRDIYIDIMMEIRVYLQSRINN